MKKFLLFSFLGAICILPGHLALAQIAPEGKFLKLNGIDQHLAIPNHSDFNIANGESYTLSCRIIPDDFNAQYSIVSKGNLLIPGGRYELFTYNTASAPNFALTLRNAENTNLGAPYITNLEAGKWVHLAWVYNAADKNSKVYINGELLNTVANSAIGRRTVENLYDLTVGCGWTDASNPTLFQFWPGQFDELRIWKRALSGMEVLADRTAARANNNGLVAAYDFENINNNNVPDVSGKGHNGQLFGYGIRVIKTRLPVGIGNVNERLIAFRINAESSSESVKSITVVFSGTRDVSDVSTLKVYHNGTSERLNLKTATLFGFSTPVRVKTTVTGDMKLTSGENYFWITANISSHAREGNQVQASVISYTTGDGSVVFVPDVPGSRTILLTNKLLFSGGDAGSNYYRIPAIVTARDGSLVTATDKRWNSPFDLPRHIDVVIRCSINKGQTWSHALTIAGEGTDIGFGDPALVVNRKNGEIICLFAADKGFFSSTASAPIRVYQSKSADNGISWSTPQDITPQIYGAESSNPVTQNWQGAFVTSGAATQLKSGRLMAVLPVRETSARAISNFVIYSDDNGQTWKVTANRAATNGNEAKLVGLENGNVLMSIRNAGTRMFNISKDQGMTWGVPFPQPAITDPFCNGDMIRYTAISDGYNKNRLLHSIPFSNSRSNISVLLSYDEGGSWPVKKTIYPGVSAYSSLCILNDGTIGIYYEVGEYETYQMYFVRFSLDWLTNGADTWIDKRNSNINTFAGFVENPSAYTVYPNPAEGVVNVSGTFEMNTLVEIYNPQGELMNSTRIKNSESHIQLSLQGFSSGIYFLKIGGTVEKIIVK